MATESLLEPLLDLIASSVKTMKEELAQAKLSEPWLSKAEFHPWDLELPPVTYWNARRNLIASLGMMTAVVQNPKERITCDATSYQYSAALNLVCRAGIPEILHQSQSSLGLSVDELASHCGVNAIKLDRVMRFLCAHHIFEERSPSTFANNRLSCALLRTCETSSFPICWSGALIAASPLLPSVLLHPSTKDSFDPKNSAFSLANRKDKNQDPFEDAVEVSTLFDFLGQPQNKEVGEAFGTGMAAIKTLNGTGGWFDFDWARFDRVGGTIVDIGSGAGHLAVRILPTLEHSVWRNYDRPEVCSQGEEFVRSNVPGALESGRLTFEPIDFFKDEIPVQEADAYILCNVLHDWGNDKALDILARVTRAMSSNSRLLVLETIVQPFVTQHSSEHTNGVAIHEEKEETPPYPLLGEWGVASRYGVLQCMEVLSLLNAVDRTLAEFEILFKEAGLEVVKVHRIRQSVSIVELMKAGGD